MNVILLEKIDNLGDIGEQVKVKPGFGRNYLLPQGKAALATPANVAKFEAKRTEIETRAAGELAEANERAARLAGLDIRLTARAGEEGKLFGSIGTVDIAEACTAAGVPVERSEVRLHEGPIRTAGEHQVELHLHTGVDVPLKVTVVGEE
ncbi:MAG: 50S ribosomal protein L9 [Gammaproteobacteria bacterium]|nr:50S ribosomal protein L9 [Gammaproteobacteria bacterium]